MKSFKNWATKLIALILAITLELVASQGLTVLAAENIPVAVNYVITFHTDSQDGTLTEQQVKTQTKGIADGDNNTVSARFDNSVTSIDSDAFRDCPELTSAIIPQWVTYIYIYAFEGCGNLTDISVNTHNSEYSSKEGVLFDKAGETLVLFPMGKTGAYTVPQGTANIGFRAFYGCSGLTGINLPDSLGSIGENAFVGCNSLTNISVSPNNEVFSSKDGVLFDKESVTLVLFPPGKTGGYTVPEGTTNISPRAFGRCPGITDVKLPDNLISVGENAFMGCVSLRGAEIPDSVMNIGDFAYDGCVSLAYFSVGAHNGEFSSKDGVLFDKDGTTLVLFPPAKNGEYTIPYGVTSISDNAFEGCSGVTAVNLPDSLLYIGIYAFASCSGLTRLDIPASVVFIGNDLVSGSLGVTEINVSPGNKAYISIDGVLFDKAVTSVIAFPQGKNGEYIIPDSVTDLGIGTFGGCPGLTNVVIPGGVTILGEYLFAGSALTSITIPDGVAQINDGAFYGCAALRKIVIPESVTSIYGAVFEGCDNLAIYSAKDAYAHDYALENNLQWLDISKP